MNKSIPFLALALIAAADSASAADGSRRHHLRLDAVMVAGGVYQPAVLNMSFDMDTAVNPSLERLIRNMVITVDLIPGGGEPLDYYTLAATGPRAKDLTYAVQTRAGFDFTIEVPTFIGVEADRTALHWGVNRAEDGHLFGSEAVIKLYPYCNADLSSCFLGEIAGVAAGRSFPQFRLRSDQRFSLAAQD